MKKLIFLTLLLVLSTSLCVNLPFDIPFLTQNKTVAQTGFSTSLSSQDLSLNVGYSLTEVKVGRDLIFYLDINNNQDYDLANVAVQVYDNPCFTEASTNPFTKTIGTLKKGSTVTWTAKMQANSGITMEKSCPIRFKVSYDGQYFRSDDIAVLPESEYILKESQGTLSSVPISSTASSSPLNVQTRFSEKQPFLEGQSYYMFVDYKNYGQGNFQNVNIQFTPTTNIDLNCGSYLTNNQITDLKFIKGQAPTTTCTMKTKSVSSIDIETFKISATYKYVLDNFITVTVKL
jgi:hypothetical protein